MKTPESGKDTNVLRKTPEEIKKGLKCCSKIEGCKNGGCSYYDLGSGSICIPAMAGDALAYIQQLESRLAQTERERDEAVKDLAVIKFCALCEEDENTQEYGSDRCHSCVNKCNWKWRGVVCENR